MPTVNLNIPKEEYEQLIRSGHFSEQSRIAILKKFDELKLRNLVAIGDGTTYNAIKLILNEKIASNITSGELAAFDFSDVDGIILTVSPIHYNNIINKINALNIKIPVVLVFKTLNKDIRLILETQPRSGTEYTLTNLLKHEGIARASVYPENGLELFSDGLLFYTPDHEGEYVVKAHFTKHLYYPEYKYVKTAYLLSYFFDSYHSWAVQLSGRRSKEDFVLTHSSLEWSILSSYFDEHLKWLDFISDKFWYRYEDYFVDFDATVRNLSSHMGMDLPYFEQPRPNPGRTYWSDVFGSRFDEVCFEAIRTTFAPYFLKYYPEKCAVLQL